MKNNRLLFLWLMIVSCNAVVAQYTPAFSHNYFNKLLTNPAYAGSAEGVELNLLHRSQYVNVANKAVSSQYFGFSMPIYALKSGIGLTVMNDFIGYSRNTYINFAYSYLHKFNFATLGVGINVGFAQSSLDGTKLRTPEGQYFSGINHNDTKVPIEIENAITPDFGVGVSLSSKKFYAGVGVNHLYTKLNFPTTAINVNRMFYLNGGYEFKIGKKVKTTPTLLLQTNFSQIQLQVGNIFSIYDNILTGVALRGYSNRSLDAATFYIGGQYKGVRLVYSYDVNVSYLRAFNTGSHEISLQYIYPLKQKVSKGNKYFNDRYL